MGKIQNPTEFDAGKKIVLLPDYILVAIENLLVSIHNVLYVYMVYIQYIYTHNVYVYTNIYIFGICTICYCSFNSKNVNLDKRNIYYTYSEQIHKVSDII